MICVKIELILLLVSVVVTVTAVNPKGVALDIQTDLIFDQKDAAEDRVVVRNIRRFLDQVEALLGEPTKQDEPESINFRADHKENFLTDFLEQLTDFITTINSKNYKVLMKTLSANVESRCQEANSFNKIISNAAFINFVKNNVKRLVDMSQDKVRQTLNQLKQENNTLTLFVSHLNSYFNEKDTVNFKKIMNQFNKNAKANKSFDKPVKNALNFIVYDRFDKLNYTAKFKVGDNVDKLSEYLMANGNRKMNVNWNLSDSD